MGRWSLRRASLRQPRHHRHGFASRALALSMALSVIGQISPAYSAPGDIFSIAAPAVSTDPPKEAPLHDGDASVSNQTGAFGYSYPIRVPPGRNGMQPHLALNYSSQAPIYGGLAAGWSLSIPIITEDTSRGRLWTSDFSVALKTYTSSMAGGRPLAPVVEPSDADVDATFRAPDDASFMRYQKIRTGTGFLWRVLATDGTIHYFGDADHVGACTTVSEGFAPLTRTVDAFGNSIDYFYEAGGNSECRISSITWGQNAAASTNTFASITFNYDPTMPDCAGIPVGTQPSFRTGAKIFTGSSKLDTMTISAIDPDSTVVHQRVITLSYSADDASCTAPHGAFRSLVSIQESAWGVNSPRVDLPPIKFSYGPTIGSSKRFYPQRLTGSTSPAWGVSPQDFNLGWGHRYDDGKWPTVEAMMLDIDGDGLPDRVLNSTVSSGPGVITCGALWRRNLGPGRGFDNQRLIALPTLKWGTRGDDPDVYHGGAFAGQNIPFNPAASDESCSLNYQETTYKNSQGSACANLATCNDRGFCPDGSDCGGTNNQGDTKLAYRWFDIDGDGLVDLVASIASGGIDVYNLQQGNGLPNNIPAPLEPQLFGSFPPCPTQSTPGLDIFRPYTMCGGMYPWFVYKNHGNGVFGVVSANSLPLPDRIIYQPVPLETDTGDSALWSLPIGQDRGVLDIDGDGYPDSVLEQFNQINWKVFRNDGTGALVASVGNLPFLFRTPQIESLSETSGGNDMKTVAGLIDIDGDGLIDRWSGSTSSPSIELNDGLRFLLQGSPLNVRPGTDVHIFEQDFPPPANGVIRNDMSRLLDIDGDGRVDVLQASPGTTLMTAYLNQGGNFGPEGAGEIGYGFSLAHTIVSIPPQGNSTSSVWEIRSDMIDLNGDGIPEGVDFDSSIPNPQFMQISDVADTTLNPDAAPLSQPPRLLIGIDNGRGAITSVAYASMTDSTVVEQHPELGRTMPHAQWVVHTTSVADAPAGTTTTTVNHYKNPVFSADDRGRYAFRGFEETEITRPSGAIAVERYDYSVDWSGRLKTELVMPAGTSTVGEVYTIDETSWAPFALFGGLTTFFAATVDHWTCKNGQVEAACRTNTDTHTRTISSPEALSSTTSQGGPALLYKITSTTLLGGTTSTARYTQTSFAVDADERLYRVRPLVTTKMSQAGGPGSGSPLVLYAKTAHTWDETYRVPLTDEIWVDGSDANRAITRRVYDMTTGNVVQRWKPEQNAANTTNTTYAYDSRKLFVATEVNELGFEYDYAYEYGTGVKLQTLGPNVPGCAQVTPPTCSTGNPLVEQRKIQVDGLGRMIARWEPFSDSGVDYSLFEVEQLSYDDNSWYLSHIPTSVMHVSAFDTVSNGLRSASDRTDMDGLGRTLKKTIFTLGTAAHDDITSFRYHDDGTLSSVTIPDPSGSVSCAQPDPDAGCTVTYTYTFDTLGRPSGMRRPDAPTPTAQSGLDISYDGLTRTETEVVAGSGQPAITKTTSDAFGRTIEVAELRTAPDQWATTTYTYTCDDNVNTITNPESQITTLVHDFAGRRTQVTRANQSRSYTYDRNGNMRAELIPGWTAILDQPNYTNTFAYDDLDRITSKSFGQRGLSADDQAEFATGTEAFIWDVGDNHKGHLRYWRSYAPGSSSPTISVDVGNNLQGQRTEINQSISIASLGTLSRQFSQNYYLSQLPHEIHYRDYFSSSMMADTFAQIQLDARGLPSGILLAGAGGAAHMIAAQTRNIAGLVTKRHTDVTGQPITFVESNWTYDTLGRVTSQTVQEGSSPIQVARQALAYFGNDDISQLDHWLGSANHKQFHYGYDPRHQITSVTETAAGGAFGATYTYSAAGRFVKAIETHLDLPGSDVVPRNVTYMYSAQDPEEVTALVNADGSTYMSYTYDAAGNQQFRGLDGVHFDYVYDGKDQLRRTVFRSPDELFLGSEEYWYDDSGQRIITVKRDLTGEISEMIWFVGDTEAHYDSAGNLTHIYSNVSLGTPVARVDRTGDTTTAVEYQFHGLANSLLAAVDQSGRVNASFDYAPFGEVIEATDTSDLTGVAAHRRRLNDKYVDELSGLAYYGARYYDKLLMGWTQGDPLYRYLPDLVKGKPRRSQLYQFSFNNPLRYIDPDGKSNNEVAAERHVFCVENPDEDSCTGKDTSKQGSVAKPARDHDYTDKEATDIETALGFDPDGIGQTMTGAAHGVPFVVAAREAWNEAQRVSAAEYKGKTVGLNDEEDAFRHAYASYVLTLKTNRRFAQDAGDAHERSYANPHNERVMDLYNNSVGRRLAQDPTNRDRPPIQVIHEAIKSGLLMTEPLRMLDNPMTHGQYHDYKKWHLPGGL